MNKSVKKALWIVFNIAFLGVPLLFNHVNKKVRLTITLKTTLLFTLIFAIVLIFIVVFLIKNVETYFSLNKFTPQENAKFLAGLKVAMAVFVPLFLAMALSLGSLASAGMLKPIRKMTTTLKNVTPKDLSLRLTPIDSHDELRALTDIVNQMLDRLEQTFNQQTEFVSNASHELRTPIAVIQGYSNLLDRWGKENSEILQEALTAISKESDNMKSMVEKLLFITKLGNRYPLNPSTFLLNELMEEVVKETALIDASHKISLDKMDIVEVYADYHLLKQALRVLVDNAVKYSPLNTAIELAARKRVRFLDDGTAHTSTVIEVRDHGKGIEEQDLPHIFDRFYRCDKARGRAEGSTGLGLSIAKQIIELHGGTLTAKSKPNEGSVFTITV